MLEWSTSGNLNNSNSPGISGELIPYIESITPPMIPGTGTTEITIIGENFIPNNNLSIPASVLTISGASSVVYSIISPTRISAIITTSNATGNLSVTIANGNRVSSIWGETFIFSHPDPHVLLTSLLLKGDGVNGGTNIIDSSPTTKTVSRFGNVALSTAQKKYGESSLFLTGAVIISQYHLPILNS